MNTSEQGYTNAMPHSNSPAQNRLSRAGFSGVKQKTKNGAI